MPAPAPVYLEAPSPSHDIVKPAKTSRDNMKHADESSDSISAAIIERLPNELLLHVMSYLDYWDSEPPSVSKFSEEPSLGLTVADGQPLKDLSTISHRWRKLVLPNLFRYARVRLCEKPQWVRLCWALFEEMKRKPAMRSMHERQVLKKLELYVDNPANHPRLKPRYSCFELNYIDCEDCQLQTMPEDLRTWIPSLRSPSPKFLDFLAEHDLERYVVSLVIYTAREVPTNLVQAEEVAIYNERLRLWESIFSRINPARVVVAAPPTSMAALTEGWMQTPDAWAFDMQFHYLELRQVKSTSSKDALRVRLEDIDHRTKKNLHNIRRWVHLGYNEGSSLAAYSKYEYYWKRPPKVLYHLLLWLSKELKCSSSPKLHSFQYIAIFPFAHHVADLFDPLSRMFSLRSMRIQISPGPQSRILDNPQRVGQADVKDCWAEFGRSYRCIAGVLERSLTVDHIIIDDYTTEALVEDLDTYFTSLTNHGWSRGQDGSWKKDVSAAESLLCG